jgi:GAF domain-containing protein
MIKTIQETLSRIAASLDLQEVLRTITENARRLAGSDMAQINLYDRETDRAWVGVRDERRPEKGKEVPLPLPPPTPPRPEGLTMQIIRQGVPVIVNDVLSHPLFANYQPARKWGIRTWAGFPIKREEVVVGVLMVAFVQPHRLDQRERNALELLAIQAAVAIENARLFKAERERRQMADALAEVSRILSDTLDLSDLLDLTLEQLGQVIPYDSCSISLLQGHEQMRVVAGRGFPDLEKILQLSLNLSGSLMSGKVMRDRAVVVIPDARQEPRWRPKGEYAQRIMSWIGVPLIARGKVLGVLAVDSLTPGVYSAADAEKVAAFAHHAAVAIERARLFEAEQERRRIAEVLSRTASILTSTLDPGEVLELVLDSLRSVVAYDSSAIFLRQGDRLVLTAGRGFPESAKTDDFSFDINDSALEPILTEKGQPMIISDVLASERFRLAEGSEYIRSWIGAPLWARGKLVGLLTVDHSRLGMYSEKDSKKVMDFANQAAISIENARLHASVQVHAEELQWRVEDRTAELRREKEKTEAILRSVADGVVVTGLDGEILLANPVATRWLIVPCDSSSSGWRKSQRWGMSSAASFHLAPTQSSWRPTPPDCSRTTSLWAPSSSYAT